MEDKDFAEAMTRMIAKYGKDVLLGNKAKAYVSDYKGQFNMEADVFIKLLEADCARFINEADNVPERKRQLAERMDEKHVISPRHSMPLLDLLGYLLRGDTSIITKSAEELKAEEEAKIRADYEAKLRAEAEMEARIKAEVEAKLKAEAAAKAGGGAAFVASDGSRRAVDTPQKAPAPAPQQAAKAKYVQRMHEAEELWHYDKFEKANKLFEALANEGYAPAQYKIGASYDWGIGVWKNLKKAAEWYRKAAEQGNADAVKRLDVLKRAGKI